MSVAWLLVFGCLTLLVFGCLTLLVFGCLTLMVFGCFTLLVFGLPATRKMYLRHEQFYVLPHRDGSCFSNSPSYSLLTHVLPVLVLNLL